MMTYVCGFLIIGGILMVLFFGRNVDWIESARLTNGGMDNDEEVDGAWQLLRVVPYLGFVTTFWIVYFNIGGPWTNQGCPMDCRVWRSTSQYNPASWVIWDSIVIMVLIRIFDWVVYPFVGKLIGRPEGPTALQKMQCMVLGSCWRS